MKLEQAYAALRFDPAVPWWAWYILAACCALVLLPALFRRARGAIWRVLAFAVLLAWLAGPRLVQETRDALPDIGLFVIDKSASMNVGDRAKLRDAAQSMLAQAAGKMPDLEMRTVEVPEGGHDGTHLFDVMNRALADIPRSRLAGIVALTDGQVHDVPAEPPPAPLHVLIPAKGEQTDRRLRIIEAPAFGLVGRTATIRMIVEDLGAPPNHNFVRLVIRRDGGPSQVQSVMVGQESAVDVPITRAGPTIIEMQADKLPGAVSDLNNRAVIEINGVRDRLRVLLVSGEPHQGERTWRRLLKSDPAVDLVHFTILRPPERDDLTPTNELSLIAFPVRELFQVKIRDFDLIILDRFQNRNNLLPPLYLRNIADYVRGGGGLLLSVGPEFVGPGTLAATALASILPVRPAEDAGAVVEGGFRPQVTALGTRHPVTENLPGWKPQGPPDWGSWYRRIEAPSGGGQALMSAQDGSPLLLLDRVEQGRVAMLLSDQIWLWSRGHQGGGPQAELLRRIAHWLMKEPALEEEALRARITDDRLQIERRTLEDKPPGDVVITAPGGAVTRLPLKAAQPGFATAEADAADPGVWQVSDGVHTVFAAEQNANPRELADLRATATILAPITRASGGSIRFIGDGTPELRRTEPGHEASGGSWVGLPRRHDHVVTGLNAIPLLPPWAALPLLLGLVVVAWRQEGASRD